MEIFIEYVNFLEKEVPYWGPKCVSSVAFVFHTTPNFTLSSLVSFVITSKVQKPYRKTRGRLQKQQRTHNYGILNFLMQRLQ